MRIYSYCIAAAMSLSSCATIFSGSTKVFGVDCNPENAHVEITNRKGVVVFQGQTPVTTSLKTGGGYFRPATYSIKLTLDGYQSKVIVVESHINGWYFGNVLIGGALGMLIIDPLTGAMYRFNSTEAMVDATLTPNSTSFVPAIKVIELKDVPADQRGKLVKLPG